MDIRIRESNNISIIDIDGQIDINAAEIIEAVGWLMKNKKKDILLNFDKVNMVDYSGISILAIAYKNVVNHKGKMKFCNVPLHVEELFKLVRLDNIFEIYRDEESAVNTFYHESPVDNTTLRRRFKRLDIQAEAEFCTWGDPNKVWHQGRILNISGEGLFIHAKSVLPLGTKVALRLNLLSGEIIDAEGIIIWLADKSLQIQSYPGMGIYFKDMAKKVQDKIVVFINRHITSRSTND
ncbi:MAG: STAS domain-containing protein [Candidatus Omnitrophica bacterium]|nr:STAS domain-containing protein [Candidatus Omnitrophota bacterium]MBU4488867.1 STAS domain-containing protein [Candidatus Omnitrophota bacterium]MCG2705665.1 STAS domain-containing protein [Candidatus Omnitrophota bacterium]